MEQIIDEMCECPNTMCENGNRIQPITEFLDNNGRLVIQCKKCREYDREHRNTVNSSSAQTARAKYRSTDNYKELAKINQKNYLNNNLEAVVNHKIAARKHYNENKDEINRKRREKAAREREIKKQIEANERKLAEAIKLAEQLRLQENN